MATGRKVEVEVKYRLRTTGAGDRYLVAPELGPFVPAGPVRTVQIEDRYMDTADWALSRAGYAARMRRTTRGTTIGLKGQAAADGRLVRREEIEGPADPDTPPTEWPDSPARTVILELCGDAPLAELLTIRQSRHLRRLESPETKAELSVDEVEALAGDSSLARFDELEIELESGPEEPLHAVCDILDRDEDLRHSSRSKLERAIRALDKALPTMPAEVQQRWADAPADILGRRDRQSAAEAREAAAERDGSEAADGAVTGVCDDDGAAPAAAGKIAVGPGMTGPRAIGVRPDDTLPEAARKVLAFHFAKMRAKERGARSGADTEDLHDMRVASRRMRAAWRVFDEAFKPGRTRKLRARLKVLSDKLGAVRDLDVLVEGLEAYRGGLDADQQPGLDTLLGLWRRQRNSARLILIDELDSRRFTGFVAAMEEFLEAGSNEAATVASPTLPHRVMDRAPSQIWAAYEAVRAYELVLPWADIETLHDLRIACKWLRYDLEFFGEALGSDAPHLLERVMDLQDFLGCLHDADVAAKLARDVLVARAGELSSQERDAIGAYLHSRERELARRRRALGPVWRAVVGAPFRRALGRATAAL
jgi:CHAD domain-containing protein